MVLGLHPNSNMPEIGRLRQVGYKFQATLMKLPKKPKLERQVRHASNRSTWEAGAVIFICILSKPGLSY